MKPKGKQLKVKAEPPPKKRKKWKEEFSSSQSDSSPEIHSSSSDNEGEFSWNENLEYIRLSTWMESSSDVDNSNFIYLLGDLTT